MRYSAKLFDAILSEINSWVAYGIGEIIYVPAAVYIAANDARREYHDS